MLRSSIKAVSSVSKLSIFQRVSSKVLTRSTIDWFHNQENTICVFSINELRNGQENNGGQKNHGVVPSDFIPLSEFKAVVRENGELKAQLEFFERLASADTARGVLEDFVTKDLEKIY